MASLLNLRTGEKVNLLAQHVVGRHPGASNTVLVSPDASRVHATILWDGEDWLLQDSSTNGTFVNGKRVVKNEHTKVNRGDEVHFASLEADGWRLLDTDAPKSVLIPETFGAPSIYLEDIAVLPHEDVPEVTLYLSPQGHWVCESKSGTSELQSGDLVGTNQGSWRFYEAKPCAETVRIEEAPVLESSQVEIFFNVSQNEEHVSLKLKMDDQEFDLGERNHHYLTLLLARKRIEDQEKGISESEQGWIEKDQLSQMLGLSENHINIQVYRFRKQLVKALPKTLIFPQVIERRTGEIRFAYDNIVIEGGTQMAKAL